MDAENDLIQRLREGQQLAFKALFDQHYRPLTLFAFKYVGELDEAKEIVQEFFVRFWTKHAELDIHFSLKAYLYQGVRNACLSYLESNKTIQRHLRGYSRPFITHDNALERMLLAEQEERLMQAIDRLPEKCRQIFLMSRQEKRSNQSIAELLGISVKTVEAQMTIALKRLREWLVYALLLILFS